MQYAFSKIMNDAGTTLNFKMGETNLFADTILSDSSVPKPACQLYCKASPQHS